MKRILLKLIRFYQLVPHARSCRFEPSCSQYLYQAVNSYGIITGTFLGLKRIARCHPLSRGGYDPLVKDNL